MSNPIEDYFNQEKIPFEPIGIGNDKTPDYKIQFNSQLIIVEFKEFKCTKNDVKRIEKLKGIEISAEPRPREISRIRNKIKKCSKQFANYQDKPTLCVLCGIEKPFFTLSPIYVMEAMLGDISYSLPITLCGKQIGTEGFKYGRNAPPQIRREKGGSLISAVAILERVYPNQGIIDMALDPLIQESKQKGWDNKQTFKKGFRKTEDVERSNPNIDFNEFKWRLRIFHTPYSYTKVKFPLNVFSGKWDETYVYQDNLGYKKL